MGSRSGGARLVSGSGGMRRRSGMWTLASATWPPFRPRFRNVNESCGGKQQRCEDQNRGGSHRRLPHIMGIMINAWPSELFRK